MKRVYNFSAGPTVLPEEVLREAADEMISLLRPLPGDDVIRHLILCGRRRTRCWITRRQVCPSWR